MSFKKWTAYMERRCKSTYVHFMNQYTNCSLRKVWLKFFDSVDNVRIWNVLRIWNMLLVYNRRDLCSNLSSAIK